MAYEYLNETTDAIFRQNNLATNELYIAMMFYEYTLIQPKFRSQRFHFQKQLSIYYPSYCTGYFNKRKSELLPEVRNKLYPLKKSSL